MVAQLDAAGLTGYGAIPVGRIHQGDHQHGRVGDRRQAGVRVVEGLHFALAVVLAQQQLRQ